MVARFPCPLLESKASKLSRVDLLEDLKIPGLLLRAERRGLDDFDRTLTLVRFVVEVLFVASPASGCSTGGAKGMAAGVSSVPSRMKLSKSLMSSILETVSCDFGRETGE